MRPLLMTILCALAFLGLTACGGQGGDRQENIESLRTFGIAAAPLVNSPSVAGQPAKTVEVTFYAAVPLGVTAALTPFVDHASSLGAVPLPAAAIAVEDGSESYEDYNNYRLFSAKAKLALPTAAAFRQADFAGGQVRYGLTVTAGGDHEDIVADLVLFPEGAPQLAWQNPTIAVIGPINASGVPTTGTIDLKAEVGNVNDEGVKVGWFVSKGQVANRRAAATTWKLTDAGPQTVAVVVHGIQSRGFAVKVIDVTGN
jgi:hypothetical protein